MNQEQIRICKQNIQNNISALEYSLISLKEEFNKKKEIIQNNIDEFENSLESLKKQCAHPNLNRENPIISGCGIWRYYDCPDCDKRIFEINRD